MRYLRGYERDSTKRNWRSSHRRSHGRTTAPASTTPSGLRGKTSVRERYAPCQCGTMAIKNPSPKARVLCARSYYARFSRWQQLIPACSIFLQQSFSHSAPQQADAVLSFPQPLQHDAPLSALMQDFASLPQQDLPSFEAQHDIPSFLSAECSWRAQQDCSRFASADI